MSAFQGGSTEDLQAWLKNQRVDTSTWGQGAAKPVFMLWQEVQEGETSLAMVDGRLLRRVTVLNVLIRDSQGRSLIEHQQVLPTGSVRTRDLPLSEKLLPDESWRDAVARAVAEELGEVLPPGGPQIEVDDATYLLETETKESQSYPGVSSQYTCHRVTATVEGLPSNDFMTTERRADGTLQHRWVWR